MPGVLGQKRLAPPGNGTDQIFAIARDLLRTWLADNADAKIHLLGVGTTTLSAADQDDLFAGQDSASGSGVDQMVDEIRDRFGLSSVGRARTLERRE